VQRQKLQVFEVQSFGLDTGPQSFCHSFIALSIKGASCATTVLKLGGPRGWDVPQKIFLSEDGGFWCILGGASALYVATAQESEAEEEGRERALVQI